MFVPVTITTLRRVEIELPCGATVRAVREEKDDEVMDTSCISGEFSKAERAQLKTGAKFRGACHFGTKDLR